jgi:acetoin utilization deacetylase AcuC-like enzyme
MKISFSPIYKYQLPEGHRFPMDKYNQLPQKLKSENLVDESVFFHPQKLTESELLSTHTPQYLHHLNHLSLTKIEARKIGFPLSKQLIERGKYISKGTHQCALYAMDHEIAFNIAGGTHHAYAGHGEGFCIFNDFAITSNLLLQQGVKRILIVDLDVHQGNGTAHIFRDEDRVFTFSMHGELNYPSPKEQSDYDIGLPDGMQDDAYLNLLQQHLPRLIEMTNPQIVLYLAGVDVLATDKLGRLSLSLEGCYQRDYFVFDTLKRHQIPVAVSMGGGYSPDLDTIVQAHFNTYKAAVNVFLKNQTKY